MASLHKDVDRMIKQSESDSRVLTKVHKSMDDTYAKASDAKSVARDCLDNTETVISRVSKLQKTVETVMADASPSVGRTSPSGGSSRHVRGKPRRNRTRSSSSSSSGTYSHFVVAPLASFSIQSSFRRGHVQE